MFHSPIDSLPVSNKVFFFWGGQQGAILNSFTVRLVVNTRCSKTKILHFVSYLLDLQSGH